MGRVVLFLRQLVTFLLLNEASALITPNVPHRHVYQQSSHQLLALLAGRNEHPSTRRIVSRSTSVIRSMVRIEEPFHQQLQNADNRVHRQIAAVQLGMRLRIGLGGMSRQPERRKLLRCLPKRLEATLQSLQVVVTPTFARRIVVITREQALAVVNRERRNE